MGRFEKLNDDIRQLAEKILEDQDLCKLIHYPDNNPLDMPKVNGKKDILDKRLLLLAPKFPLATEVGSYISIRVPISRPSSGGSYIASLLYFDIFVHEKSRDVYYKDKDGNVKYGNRAKVIEDRIETFMSSINIGVGKPSLDGSYEISNNDATFSGYSLRYKDVDFRNQGV